MRTRRRAEVKVKSKDDEPNKRFSPRKKRRTDYISTDQLSDHVLSSEGEDEEREESGEASVEEKSPKSADRRNNDKETGAEGEPEATKTKNVVVDLVSFVSQRKPILILHKIEHLQGDFHLLLNDVELLQTGGRPASPKDQSKEKTGQDDAHDLVGETTVQDDDELHAETSQNDSHHENQEQDPDSRSASPTDHTEHDVSAGEDVVPKPVEDVVPKPVEDEAPKPVEDEALKPGEDEALKLVDTSDVQDDENQENVVEEVELMPMEEAAITQDQGIRTSLQERLEEMKNEVEIVAPILCFDLESVEAAATLPDLILQDSEQEPPDERPPQEETPAASSAQTSLELDIMDLEQLKRQKIKWQIKVLKLQEEYYSLQLQKLKK